VDHLNRVKTETAQHLGRIGRNLASNRLDAVLDDDSAGANTGTRSLESDRCGERQTIRATRTGNQNEVAGCDAGGIPAFAHGTANIGDGRCQAWAVSQGGLFSVIFM
jgi:hypothetical protein